MSEKPSVVGQYVSATVDSDPGEDYGTDVIEGYDKYVFSIGYVSGTVSMTIKLKSKSPYQSAFTTKKEYAYTATPDESVEVVIDTSTEIQWKAEIDNGDYTSGAVCFGIVPKKI